MGNGQHQLNYAFSFNNSKFADPRNVTAAKFTEFERKNAMNWFDWLNSISREFYCISSETCWNSLNFIVNFECRTFVWFFQYFFCMLRADFGGLKTSFTTQGRKMKSRKMTTTSLVVTQYNLSRPYDQIINCSWQSWFGWSDKMMIDLINCDLWVCGKVKPLKND